MCSKTFLNIGFNVNRVILEFVIFWIISIKPNGIHLGWAFGWANLASQIENTENVLIIVSYSTIKMFIRALSMFSAFIGNFNFQAETCPITDTKSLVVCTNQSLILFGTASKTKKNLMKIVQFTMEMEFKCVGTVKCARSWSKTKQPKTDKSQQSTIQYNTIPIWFMREISISCVASIFNVLRQFNKIHHHRTHRRIDCQIVKMWFIYLRTAALHFIDRLHLSMELDAVGPLECNELHRCS